MKSATVSIRSLWARFRPSTKAVDDLRIIIFSRDRAPQLDLLLRTYATHAKPHPRPVTIQYSASTPVHDMAYRKVAEDHRSIISEQVREVGFKPTLLNLMKGCRNLMFLVDDIVFIGDFDVELLAGWNTERSIFSLRLGQNIVRSFNSGVDPQPQPAFQESRVTSHRLLNWRWRSGQLDWNLPMSLDGNVLPAAEILPIVVDQPIQGPNSLEQALGHYRFLFKHRQGTCFTSSRIVNLPLNTVKVEDGFDFPNLEIAPDALVEQYLQGTRLSLDHCRGRMPDSCHMEWVPRMR